MTAARCPRCSAALPGAGRFCPACGEPTTSATEATDPGLPPVATTTAPAGASTAAPARPQAASTAKTAYPTLGAPRRFPLGRVALIAGGVVIVAAAIGGTLFALRGGGDSGTPAPGDAQVTAVAATETTPAETPAAAAPTAAATPAPSVSATPGGSPTPTPPPTPRNVNGLQVVDEVWTGRIAEAGGLRIRSAPRVEPGNVVGSVAQGTIVNVEGRVLNGQEAEQGKGTVWLIVGPNQYIYAAPGYVERLR